MRRWPGRATQSQVQHHSHIFIKSPSFIQHLEQKQKNKKNAQVGQSCGILFRPVFQVLYISIPGTTNPTLNECVCVWKTEEKHRNQDKQTSWVGAAETRRKGTNTRCGVMCYLMNKWMSGPDWAGPSQSGDIIQEHSLKGPGGLVLFHIVPHLPLDPTPWILLKNNPSLFSLCYLGPLPK